MKFYQSTFIVTFLLHSFQAHAFWPKWVDNLSAKINNITDVIYHKEFTQAQELQLHNQIGTIVINSWKQNSVAIEAIVSCPKGNHKNIKVDMQCIDNIIKINTNNDQKLKAHIIFNILVPKDLDMIIYTQCGDIIIKDVSSNLFLETKEGDIKLINPHLDVIATTIAGNILIRTDSIENSKTFSLVANKGNIEFYTTSNINCSLHASAPQGKIISELPVTLAPQTTLLNQESWKKFKQSIQGTIGKPLATLTMIADNGSIQIMPYTKQNNIF